MSKPYPPVTFLGVLPPPVNGMSLASEAIAAYLSRCCELRILSIRQSVKWLPLWRAMRGGQYLLAALRLAVRSRRDGERLYLVANARGGLWYDLLLVLIGKMRGYRILLHHQVYTYLHRHDRRMGRIAAWMGPGDAHVCLAPAMIARFASLYGRRSALVHLPNTAAVMQHEPAAAPATNSPIHSMVGPHDRACGSDAGLVLGHLSNLSIAKGLDTVLAVFEAMRHDHDGVRLVLAGPCLGGRERRMIERVQRRYPGDVIWLGPVDAEAKRRFFQGIDVMLFPSRYPAEAQPLVVIEALLAGTPVIASRAGCIEELVGDGGQCADAPAEYLKVAGQQLQQFLTDRTALQAARQRALRRASELRREVRDCLDTFAAYLRGFDTAATTAAAPAMSTAVSP